VPHSGMHIDVLSPSFAREREKERERDRAPITPKIQQARRYYFFSMCHLYGIVWFVEVTLRRDGLLDVVCCRML